MVGFVNSEFILLGHYFNIFPHQVVNLAIVVWETLFDVVLLVVVIAEIVIVEVVAVRSIVLVDQVHIVTS